MPHGVGQEVPGGDGSPGETRRVPTELGKFLNARRRSMGSDVVGMQGKRARRGGGLRRDDVAAMAGVSTPYYARLEQGIDRHPSRQVLASIGRALKLDERELAHLFRLAGLTPDLGEIPNSSPAVAAQLGSLVTSVSILPVALVDPYGGVLASTPLMNAIDDRYTPGRNLHEFLFFDPQAQTRLLNWSTIALHAIDALRDLRVRHPDDRRINDLIDDLLRRSPEFASIWDRHEMMTPGWELHRIANPVVGPISLRFTEAAELRAMPGHSVHLYTPDPGSPDERQLRRLSERIGGPPPIFGSPPHGETD